MVVMKADLSQVQAIVSIINQAKARMKNDGIDQWQDGYPNVKDIEKDILLNQGYVLINNHQVLAYMAIEFDRLVKDSFATVHRIAVADVLVGQGYSWVLQNAFEAIASAQGFDSLRIDTHPDNKAMRAFIKKHGYFPIGTLLVADGLRLAFEKRLDIIIER